MCHRRALLCLALCVTPLCLCAESVQEIADRIVFARGGAAIIKSIQTERMSGTILAGDQQGSFVMELKRPDKVRFDLSLGGVSSTKAYDGKTGWKLRPGEAAPPERMSEAETKELIGRGDMDGPFLDFAAKGINIEILGKEMLGPSLVWKLKVIPKAGEPEYYYVESTGYMVLLRETAAKKDGQEYLSQQFFQDFQRVQNTRLPFLVITEDGSSDEPIKLKFHEVELNVPIDDSRFTLTLPAAK